MNALPIGEYSNSDSSSYKLSVHSSPISHDSTVLDHEVEILKNLILENPLAYTHLNAVSEDVSEVLNHDIMVHNDLNDSNIAMSIEFKTGTPLTSLNKSYPEKQNITKQYAPEHYTKTVELDNDTSPLYSGAIKVEYRDGDSMYVSGEGGQHFLSLDTTDPDYNLQKAMNSTLSNIDTNSTNGFQGSFDNNFNNNYAFYTESILDRNTNNIVTATNTTLGYEGISTTSNIVGNNNWGKLTAEILLSDNVPNNNNPLFGALKIVQESLVCDFPTAQNNISSNSTLSKLLKNSTDIFSLQDTSLSEEQFKSLFTSEQLAKLGPEYDFKVNITAAATDGYSLDSRNSISIPNYGTDNTITSNTNAIMFNIDNSNILENTRYMQEMTDNNYFNNDSHKIYVKNGHVYKDPTSSTNLNFNNFTVLDGVEKLIATNNTDIEDLTRNGTILVIDTNNTLGEINARYNKYTDNTYVVSETSSDSRINKLVVSYSNTELDYRQDTGIIDDVFKTHYYVQSEVSTLNYSTNSDNNNDADAFSPFIHPNINAARANNSVLVFQSQSNSSLYSSSNIHNYEASGLDNKITNDKFALLSLKKSLNFEDADESTLFKTIDNGSINGVVSNVSVTNLNLTDIGDDIRVLIFAKTKDDMPQPVSNLWKWQTGDDIDGNLVNYNIDSNNKYIISEKTGADILQSKIHELLKIDPLLETTVTFNLFTDDISLPNKDVLSRKVKILINFPASLSTVIEQFEVDDNDLAFFNMSDITSEGVVQNLSGLNQPSNYQVKQYITQKEYDIAIRFKFGAYKNLWLVTHVKELTEYYQLSNINKNGQIMPDYYLMKILDPETGSQKFKATRKFISQTNSNATVTSLSTNVKFTAKDLMGFKTGIEYKNGTNWVPFSLKPDLKYNNSLDTMYDKDTEIILMNPNNLSEESGLIKITVDCPMFIPLGLNSHILTTDNPNGIMYIIPLSIPMGSLSFVVTGYTYNVATDSQYFNKNVVWSPYSVSNEFFLKNHLNDFVGTPMNNLSTHIELIDPTPHEQSNKNEVNEIKLTVKQNNDVLFSFISNKFILEDFNIINLKSTIIQHDYIVHKTAYSNTGAVLSGTEYLPSLSSDGALAVVKLKYGNNHNGISLRVAPNSPSRVSTSYFRLASDCVQIKPLNEANASHHNNKYHGRYSSLTEKIMPSLTGEPLPTNSLVHRNVHPTFFRGLINNQAPIILIRTMTVIKLVIGDKFVDDMNVVSNSNIGGVWFNRSTFNGNDCTLKAMKMFKAQTSFSQTQLEDMSVVSPNNPTGSNGDIGSLGLALTPLFSMFPKEISSTLHQINILLSPSSYQKMIDNPLDTSINESINNKLFDYKIHEFKDYAIVASRIKAYDNEKYNFKYNIPDLKVYYSPQYIGNPKNFTNWTQIQTITDENLREGVIIGSGTNNGVVKFTRNQTFVSSFIKYSILARPIATLSSYNITNLRRPLPDDYMANNYQRETYGVDIDITNTSTGLEGLAANLQTHKPFHKNFTNGAIEGLNNVSLGFNIAKYLHCREQSLLPFSFAMKSNKIKLFNGIGLSTNLPSYTEIFDGYISELSTSNKWISELSSSINNIFDASKKWNLKIKQLAAPISPLVSLNPTTLSSNNVMINGITSFGMGSYNLDLVLLDSTIIRYYTANYKYDVSTDTQKVVFGRHSTAEGLPLPWITQNDFSKSSLFKPLIVKKETCEIVVSIPNLLGDNPYNVNTLIKEAIVSRNFNNISWSRDTGFTDTSSPISFVTLSKKGAGALLNILHTTKEYPFKLLTANRPNILDIKRADGSRAFAITHDGKLVCYKNITKQVELLPQTNYSSSTFNCLTSVYNDRNISL